MKHFLWSLLCLSLVVGCMPVEVKEPEVSVRQIEVERFDLSQAKLNVHLNVFNPNDYAIKIKSIDYHFAINGVTLVENELGPIPELAANVTSQVSIPVRLSLFDAIKVGKSLLKQKTHSYQLYGSMRVNNLPIPVKFNFADVIELESPK